MSDPELSDEQLEHALRGTAELLTDTSAVRTALLATRRVLISIAVGRRWKQQRIGDLVGTTKALISKMAPARTTPHDDTGTTS